MLQFIRSKAGSFLVKLLFVALIACFGMWGIGDFVRDYGTSPTAVIKVGSGNIQADDIANAIRREADGARQMFGGAALNHDQLKQMGVVDRAVDGLVDRALFDQEAKRQHLAAGIDEIARVISQDPAFQKQGVFDKATYTGLLAANHLSEAQYIDMLRTGVPRQDLGQLATNNATAPDALVDLLYTHRAEKRTASYIFLPLSGVGDVGTPDAAAQQKYYKDNIAHFTAPEYRSLTVLPVTAEAVADSVKIDDSALQDLYQQHLDEFVLGEQRDVQNIVLPDEATAHKAAAALAAGKNFMAVGKQFGNQTPDMIDFGWLSRKDLQGRMADVAFTIKQGVVSAPMRSDFGWSILRVTGIKPPHTLSFEEAKPKLLAEAKQDAVGNALYTLSNKIEDAVAGGADIKGLAQQFNLKPFTVPAIDQFGQTTAGTPVVGLPITAPDLAKSAFATQPGQLSDLGQTNDGKFFILHVDNVTPPTPRPFANVADQVVAGWIKDQQIARLTTAANADVQSVKSGKKLADIAKAQHLKLAASQPFGHDGDPSGTLPAELTTALFSLPLGAPTSARGLLDEADGMFVAVLTGIHPADPKGNPLGVLEARQQLSADIGNELVGEFSHALRQHYTVQVNQTALERLY